MNNIRFLLFLSFFTGFFNNVFSQTADVTEGCLPLTVKFQGPNGLANYYWDFKDGVTSNLKNPSNIFNKEGTFNVSLQETPSGPVIGTIQIRVYPTPVLSATVTGGCAPVNVTLQSTSQIHSAINVSSYTWVFGDGQIATSATNSTVHNYASAGTYPLSLGIQTNFPSCNKTEILPTNVNLVSAPVASFTTNPATTVTCEDSLIVSFTNNSTFDGGMAHRWTLGNGVNSNALNPPSQKYFSGNYTATLTVRANPPLPGCTTSVSQTITVGRPPVSIFAREDSICIYNTATVKLNNPPPGTYLWNVGANGTAADLDSDGNPDLNKDSIVVAFSTPGLHPVSISVTTPDGQCTDVRTVNIFVDEVLVEIDPAGPVFTCESPYDINYVGSSNQTDASYLWIVSPSADSIPDVTSINRTFISRLDSIYYSKNSWEVFSATLIVTSNATGCVGVANSQLNMWLPNAQFTLDKSKGCSPLTVTFRDSSTIDPFNQAVSITSYEWLFGDGQTFISATPAPVPHVYADTGIYYPRLVIHTAGGCTDTSYAVEIQVGTTINTVDFQSTKTSVCPGESFDLSVLNPSPFVDGYHFMLDSGRVFHCSNDQTVTWCFCSKDRIGSQDVSLVLDNNGCYSTITKNDYITINGAIAKIDYKALCSSPMEYNFKSQSLGASSVSWNFGDTQTSALADVTHVYASTGNYNVSLTATGSGCPPNTDIVNINVRNVEARMTIDTLLCINVPYTFDASPSIDEYTSCNTGYTWEFSNLNNLLIYLDGGAVAFNGINRVRPYTTGDPTSIFYFSDPGVHTVSLIAKDINGCTDTITREFKVYDMNLPAPLISKNDICVPSVVDFDDLTTGDTTLVSWIWSFGDGAIDTLSNSNPFTHTYTIPSDTTFYPVYLTVIDELGCRETTSSVINFYKPVSVIQANDFTLCLGDTVILSATDFTTKGSHLTYDWELGNGTTSNIQTNVPIVYPVGDHTVKVVYTEVATGCKDSTTAVVSVQDYPVANISVEDANGVIDPANPICAPAQITIDTLDHVNTQPVAYQLLDFGNGQSLSSGAAWSYDKGTYRVVLTQQTSYGCEDKDTVMLNLVRPEGNFTMTKNTICRYEEITFEMKDTVDVDTWTWSFGDGITATDIDSVTHMYDFHPPSGLTYARLVLYKGLCPNNPPLEQVVYIHEVIADFDRQDSTDSDSVICFVNPPQSFAFINNSTGITNYVWDFGDNSTSLDYNPSHTYTNPGNYIVTLAADNGICRDTIRKEIIINPSPTVVVIGDTVCEGSLLYPYVLNPDPTSTYSWEPSTGLSDPSSTNPVANLNSTVVYEVTETNIHGCIGSASVAAIVIEDDPLNDWDTTIVIGDHATLPAFGTPIYNFAWTPSVGLSCLDCDYPRVQPLSDTTYYLTVTDTMSCFTSNYTFKVYVIPETFVKMPTAFTPNGDNNNDILYVKGWGIKDLISYQIFNRWGQLIYSSSDITQGWDGKFKGVLQNEDVYVYKVLVTDWHDKELFLEGFVNLLH